MISATSSIRAPCVATRRVSPAQNKRAFATCSSRCNSILNGKKNALVHQVISSSRSPAQRTAMAAGARAEISYVMIKPDGVQRGLVGEIISRFERKGFKLIGLKMMQCTKEIAEEHYKDLKSKPFFPALVDYILSGPVVCMVLEGDGVIKSARKLIGATNPLEAEPGTIRGDLAVQTGRNVVHGSDSPENGERETALWFNGQGIVAWDSALEDWLIEANE